MRKIGFGALFLLILTALALGGVILSDRLSQPAEPDPATLLAKAARYHVRIVRDNFGVPHIFGRTDTDAGFGIGFVGKLINQPMRQAINFDQHQPARSRC